MSDDNVVKFPEPPKRETMIDFLADLVDIYRAGMIEDISVVISTPGGRCHVLSFNVDASACAFHAIMLQHEAMKIGELLEDAE